MYLLLLFVWGKGFIIFMFILFKGVLMIDWWRGDLLKFGLVFVLV